MTVYINGTTGISGVDGSAGTPAVQGTDTNTGVFYPAADTVGISTGGSERMRVDSSGNVGIGTSSPAFKLELVGGTNNGIHLKDAASATVYGGLFTQSTNLALVTRSNHALTFGTNDTERMRIDSSGNICVGTASSPSNARFRCYGNASADFNFGSQTGAGNNAFVVYNQSNVGVYLVSGNTSWTATSDERLKDIIEPITNATEKVSTLRAVIGKYKTDEEGTRRSFLIAQDVQKVLPEAVNVNPDEMQTLGVQYTEVIPLLVASIKELKSLVDTQASTIQTLTDRITALENK